MDQLTKFIEEINQPFKYEGVNQSRTPFTVGEFDVGSLKAFHIGYHNYHFPDLASDKFTNLPERVRDFIQQCVNFLDSNQIPFDNRKFHLSLDNTMVMPGQTQREAKWHIDAPQGEKPALVFLACDMLPTEFITDSPNVTTYPNGEFASVPKEIEFINELHKNSSELKSSAINLDTIYLMNSYQVHRGVYNSLKATKRTFVRLIVHSPVREKLPIFSTQEYAEHSGMVIKV